MPFVVPAFVSSATADRASKEMTAAAQIHGLKLKTVSRCTILFALLCLVAFLAGRPPASTGASMPANSRIVRPAAHHVHHKRSSIRPHTPVQSRMNSFAEVGYGFGPG
jgi:hypothetical protein